MIEELKIALAQINPTIGSLGDNTKKILAYIEKAKKKNADLVIFSELVITGYPPKDLLLKPSFIRENRGMLNEVMGHTKDISVILGFVDESKNNLYNAAALISDRKLIGVQHKMHLPNYDVFDEKRYFEPAKDISVFDMGTFRVGMNICEDIWVEDSPAEIQAKKGAELIVNISASPFYTGKTKIRQELLSKRSKDLKVPIVYLNLVGGQDDLVFDGGSSLFDKNGELLAQCKLFEEDLLVTSLKSKNRIVYKTNRLKNIHDAIVLGISDYVRKNGFKKVVIGLSGGIDSALTAYFAYKALGSDKVLGISMPSKFSSKGSLDDAKKLAENLKIGYKVIPIWDIFEAYLNTLSSEFGDMPFNVAEENIQARIRGNILMAMSNKFGYLVLSTGNKSETAVGYATLYGDMAGGLAVISDVPKTTVYELARYVNTTSDKDLIPESVITKEPSAELREGQKDSDSLPAYEILDKILHAYIEDNMSEEEIIALGFDREVVYDVIWKVDHNEYKRQQAPIGIKITPKAFGSGRRMPITNVKSSFTSSDTR